MNYHEEDVRVMRRFLATWAKDPLNPKATVIPVNTMRPEDTPSVLSLLEAPDAPAQPWNTPRPGIPAGLVEEHTFSSRSLENTRRLWTYTPAGWAPDERGCPLLLAFDGWNAVEVTRLPVVLDNLIAAGAIPPTVAVLVDSGTLEMRMRELDCHEPFVAFLTDEILPWARERWSLVPDRSRTLVAGVSAGGEAAVFAGLRRPDVFGKVIGQSTAVTESLPPSIADLAHRPATESDRLELYLDVGLLEVGGDRGFLLGGRRLNAVLPQAGHVVHYAELACGHDELVFGETIADGLSLLLRADAPSERE